MNGSAPAQPIETEILAEILREILTRERHIAAPISQLDRALSPFGSSFPLEELTVTLEDGKQLQLIFKNVSPRGLPAAARAARPSFLDDPLREIEAYRSLLAEMQPGTPVCYGCHVDARMTDTGFFLEKVEGRPSFVGDFEIWRIAARRLALCTIASSSNVSRRSRQADSTRSAVLRAIQRASTSQRKEAAVP
jgi:hypothetical protein